MIRTRQELKKEAKRCLLGNYGNVIAAMIIAYVIVMVISFAFQIVNGIMGGVLSIQENTRTLGYVVQFAGSIVMSLLLVLAEAVILPGILYMYMKIARRESTSLNDLTYGFHNRPWRYLGMMFLFWIVSVVIMIPGIIIIILGSLADSGALVVLLGILVVAATVFVSVWLMLAYAMSFIIMVDDSECGIFQALRESRLMMKGRKGALFVMYLSFIGVGILGSIAFIGQLWTVPYMTTTLCLFYMDCKESLEHETVYEN